MPIARTGWSASRSPAITRTRSRRHRASFGKSASNPLSSAASRWASIWFRERPSAVSIRRQKYGRSPPASLRRVGRSEDHTRSAPGHGGPDSSGVDPVRRYPVGGSAGRRVVLALYLLGPVVLLHHA